MKIWVYLNGIQQGPYTLEQVRLLSLEPSTPVWYEGLSKWIPASEAPVLADLFGTTANGPTDYADPQPMGGVNYGYNPQAHYAPGSDMQGNQMPKRPPVHLVWCILLTILCCSPFGIAGLITGSFSSQRYNRGDYAGAEQMSNVTEWMVILGIVWALIGFPLMMAFWV